MKGNTRKFFALGMAAVLTLSAFADPSSASAAQKKVKLSKTKIAMKVGEKTTLTLKNYTGKKRIKWTVNKKKVVKITTKGKKKIRITAKKKGSVKITAKAGKKKYTCKVTVTNVVSATANPAVQATSGTTISVTQAPASQTAAPQETSPAVASEAPTESPVVDVTEANQSHALLQSVTSTSKEVQGVSVYSKSNVHLIQVFGSFTDITQVYDSLSFQYAAEDTQLVTSEYSPEAYFSDGTPGYYTIELEGSLGGETVKQTYFLGRAGVFTYKENRDATLTIKNYEGWGEHLAVPAKLDGHDVTICGKESFYHKKTGDIVLPEGITVLRNKAFYNAQMSYIELPDSLEEIGTEAFLNCSSLTGVALPSHLKIMGMHAFHKTPWYESLQPDENGMIIVGSVLFDGYAAAGEVEIPDDIVCIARGAFLKNQTMTKVTVPTSVTRLSSQTFANCASLAAVSVPETLQQFESDVFYNTPWLSTEVENSEDSLVILNDVLIDGQAAEGSITIPDNVIAIAPYALASVDVTDVSGMANVREIGSHAFEDSFVESISLPDTLETIGEYAFQDSALESVVIPESVTTIPQNAFSGCAALNEVQLSSQTALIEKNAFYGCIELSSINLPATVKTIGSMAFYRCDALEEVTVNGADTQIEEGAFDRCYNEDLTFYVMDNSPAFDYAKAKGYAYTVMSGSKKQ